MARRTMFATLVVMVVAAAALIEGTAAVHIVGDATGWTIPAGGAAFYSTWAANKTFAVGDILGKLGFPRNLFLKYSFCF